MAKKNIGTGGGAGVDETLVAAAAAVPTAVEYRVIGHGAWTPSGKQLALREVFVPSELGMSEAQVVELVKTRMIELTITAATKPYSQEVVTKSAVDSGDNS